MTIALPSVTTVVTKHGSGSLPLIGRTICLVTK
jgi:hypothetical protein